MATTTINGDTTISGDLQAPSGITVGGTSDKIHKIFAQSGAIDFNSASAGAIITSDVTVTGVDNSKDSAVLVSCQSALTVGLVLSGRVSAANTVQVSLLNTTSNTIDEASKQFDIVVFQLEA